MPYYGYSRQDRKDQPRVAIGAKLVANMIMTAGADRVLGIDFHQHQLQGFFDIPVDHLYAMPVLTAHFRKKQLKDPVVVAPDVGSAKMARGFAKRLDASLAIIDKRRPRANVAEVVNVVGEVEGRDCILADDMIDTAGTVTEAARALKRLGREGHLRLRHARAVVSGPAVERLEGGADRGGGGHRHDRPPAGAPVRAAHDALGRRAAGKAIRFTHAEQSVSSVVRLRRVERLTVRRFERLRTQSPELAVTVKPDYSVRSPRDLSRSRHRHGREDAAA